MLPSRALEQSVMSRRHAFSFFEHQSKCATYFLATHSFYVNTFNYSANVSPETMSRQIDYRFQIEQGDDANG